MLWIVDGGMISLPVVARVEDFNEDSHIEITTADENHEWKSEPTRYEKVVRCKECKYFGEYCDEYKEETQNDGMCELDIKDSVTFDFFCADGERRDPCSSQDS